MRRKIEVKRMVRFLSLLVVVVFITAAVSAEKNPADSLRTLMEGNTRYVSGQPSQKESGEAYRKELAKGQQPYAVVVACSDSRVAPEVIFDEGLGRIFVIRTAGNVVDPIALGSIEYAVEHLHAPLVVVLGHESCGAVKATVDSKGKPEGNIGAIIKKIMPAVESARASLKSGEDLAYASTIQNVKNVAHEITKKSKIIAKEAHEGKVKVVGAFYSISTGKVEAVEVN